MHKSYDHIQLSLDLSIVSLLLQKFMKIINQDWRDYHIHSSNFSDWTASIEEITRYVWDIWLKEIAITDHSQAVIDLFINKYKFYPSTARFSLARWQNVRNDVNVIFWVEWDLLTESWDVCFEIQWIEPDFILLSAHLGVYAWNPANITSATIKAIERYHDKIRFIWHPCSTRDYSQYYDIVELVKVANEYDIPLEFNTKNFSKWCTDLDKLDYLLKNANQVYINSDAHSLAELRDNRKNWLDYLKDKYWLALTIIN